MGPAHNGGVHVVVQEFFQASTDAGSLHAGKETRHTVGVVDGPGKGDKGRVVVVVVVVLVVLFVVVVVVVVEEHTL